MMKFSLCQFCYWFEVLRTGRESNWWSKNEVFWCKQILMLWKFVWTVFLIYFDFSARCTGNRKETILVWKLIDTPKVKRSVYVHVTFFLIKCTSRPSNLGVEYSLTCTVYSVVVLWYEGCFPLTQWVSVWF